MDICKKLIQISKSKINVGKNVKIQIWINKKLITKNLKLGRLESSEEFKEKKSKQKKTEETEIEKLKITVL